jgi:branched-chain amino acid transport system ATP-binding protein
MSTTASDRKVVASEEPENKIVLELEGASKQFGGMKAVDNISLKLRSGVITSLIGPNGAGKTTLFNLITGHLPATSGDVRFNGVSLVGKTPNAIARMGVGRTFQDLKLFTRMSVLENIITAMESRAWFWQKGGRGEHSRRRKFAHEILERTGLTAIPNARAVDLAYAERKFLSVARLLATRLAGRTICIIEHNLDVVANLSQRVAFLDRGRLIAEGNPQEVINDPHLASIYFGGSKA